VLAVLDARKNRVYASLFEDGVEVRGPADVPPAEALSWLSSPFVASGEGAVVYAALVEAAGGTVHDDAERPAVDMLAELGVEAFLRGLGADAAALQPEYIRAPDAKPPKLVLG
jgi:tRNA A37 threonylcarbamoyladenosine modification protein TsaB